MDDDDDGWDSRHGSPGSLKTVPCHALRSLAGKFDDPKGLLFSPGAAFPHASYRPRAESLLAPASTTQPPSVAAHGRSVRTTL
ncbi:hypothetical protein C8034_v000166 [Colletotrichum sidae]|uniref:Uncharacterized protein n=1 Tax=Colletotrichum sidae TaxID=1347389 RepID=A0A4R8TP75_9PEZI|nr:hypothetical protein C8034_v000166 [Colletotrichum sidae]